MSKETLLKVRKEKFYELKLVYFVYKIKIGKTILAIKPPEITDAIFMIKHSCHSE